MGSGIPRDEMYEYVRASASARRTIMVLILTDDPNRYIAGPLCIQWEAGSLVEYLAFPDMPCALHFKPPARIEELIKTYGRDCEAVYTSECESDSSEGPSG